MLAAAAAMNGEQPGTISMLRGGVPGGATTSRRHRAGSALLSAIQGMVSDIAQLRSEVVALNAPPSGR
eukprot:4036025-Alexandrium_andersonii.AAC.1